LATVGRTAFVRFAPGTSLEGNRSRLGAEFALPVGPALLKAESIWMWMDDVRRLSVSEDLDFHSWYVSGSYLLTGESKTLGRIVPEHPLSLAHRTWGAWELAARFSRFHSDEALFRLGLASGSTQTDAVAAGLNWYINELLRLTLNYEYADFEDQLVIDGEPLDDEHAVLVQGQLEF
jgi:phosphate-selective porin OprO/OprP